MVMNLIWSKLGRSGEHFLNPILNFGNLILNLRQQLTIKFGETLPLVGTKRMDEWELCPKFEEPIGALPQIWGKWQNDVPVRLFPAFCRNHKALVIVLTGISWGLQILYCLMEFSTSAVGSIACKSAINAICNQRHLLVSIWIMTWRRAPIGPSILC